MEQYLIDSNTVSHYLSGKLSKNATDFINKIMDEGTSMSVITQIELLGFDAPKSDAILFREFVKESNVIELSQPIIMQSMALRKSQRIKLSDSLIAATALVKKLTLITNNARDFSAIDGLTVIDPYTL